MSAMSQSWGAPPFIVPGGGYSCVIDKFMHLVSAMI
jgi:hypothetical protein